MTRVVPFLSGVYFWTLYLLRQWEREREISIFQLKTTDINNNVYFHCAIVANVPFSMYTVILWNMNLTQVNIPPESSSSHLLHHHSHRHDHSQQIVFVFVVVLTQINIPNAEEKKNWNYQKFDLRFTFAE